MKYAFSRSATAIANGSRIYRHSHLTDTLRLGLRLLVYGCWLDSRVL